MPSVRLSGGQTPTSLRPAQGGPGAFNNAAASPLLLDMTGSDAKQVLWTYGCTAGGVSWPETLVLSDGKGDLVGSVNLGDIAKSEHAEVTKWSVSGKNVVLDWKQYEGAGSDMKVHHSTLSWTNGKLQLTESGSGTTSNANVPAGAAPGAGGPRPANATPLTESTHSEYGSQLAFKTPSGTNGCQVDSGWVRCGTKSGGEVFLTSSGTIPSEPPADDAPMWFEGDSLAYGQVRYNGATVFASTTNGVTVWNTKTGHGALINTSGVQQF